MTQIVVLSFIFLGVAALVSFSLFFFYGQKRMKQGERHYDFLSEFPFEYIRDGEEVSPLSRGLLIASLFFTMLQGAYMLLTKSMHEELFSFCVLYFVVLGLSFVFMLAVFLAPAYHTKPHLAFFMIGGTLGVLSSILAAIIFFNLSHIHLFLSTFFGIIMGIIAVAQFALLANPKLSTWAKMRSSVDEDGNVVTSRPRPFVLAFTEWLLYFIGSGASFLSLVGFFVLCLLQA
ncbi:MAG: hypothetical protein J6A47_04635 [Bacilli bacterium]|nr:hypothetical protein [Bacilli bacterium]MBO6286044.1 hypothetical protein [Bacilli bacterium]